MQLCGRAGGSVNSTSALSVRVTSNDNTQQAMRYVHGSFCQPVFQVCTPASLLHYTTLAFSPALPQLPFQQFPSVS
ncbi:hypothetical protein BaRGS_00020716, partial [Batillaria attramentaria]